ncbi:unnamed protein product, partial [Mesorhabditis belari]|uniref:LITAF domain-containing protein n=1 Tax=Mesorhabditis belari TaxID=2138241 RepID=A0AAF3EYE5_9BILA
MLLYFTTFLISLNLTLSQVTETHKISVIIFGATRFEDAIHSVASVFEEVFGSDHFTIGATEFRPEFIDAKVLKGENETNQLELAAETICKRVINGSIAAVIYRIGQAPTTHQDYLSLVATTAFSLGLYQVPVVAGMVRDEKFGKKLVYPTFVRPTPSFGDEAHVFLQLLEKLNYRQVSLLYVKGDRNGVAFYRIFRSRRKEFKVHVQSYVELELNDELNNTIAESFEEITSNIIVLFARRSDATVIFSACPQLTSGGKLWLMNEEAMKATNAPFGLISSRLTQTPSETLRDSFATIRFGLEAMGKGAEGLKPPTTCERDANPKAVDVWPTIQAPILYKQICSGGTSRLFFNSVCAREGVDYDLINKRPDGARYVGNLTYETLRIDEGLIYWPGGERKLLEITLPRELRVVTTDDPPFVYTLKVLNGSMCEKMTREEVNMIGGDSIFIDGPWYPCPKALPNGQKEHYCCAGYAIDLLSNMSLPEEGSSLDTSFFFSLHLNDSYGMVTADPIDGVILTGALGELVTDLADMAVGGMTINPERERFIDFSEPWLYHGIRVMEKSIPKDSPMESFLQPMKNSLWGALLISVILVGCVIFVLDFKSPFDRFYKVDTSTLDPRDPFLQRAPDDRVDFGEAMWFVWGVLLNSGVSEKTPRSCSARVLGIVWCGFCMIIVASYTANLAAFLVLDQPEKGLTGITDPRLRNPSTNFSAATVLNSNVYQYFKRHVELSTMFRKMEKHNVDKPSDAIKALLNGTLDAFIWDSSRLEFEASRYCSLRTRGTLFGRSAYGIGLQRNSPWTQHITAAILRMTESGQMENLGNKWISSPTSCPVEVQKTPARLGLTNMRDVFVLVSVGVLIGIFFSFIEVIYGRKKAAYGRKMEIAKRYVAKWQRITKNRNHRYPKRYSLFRPVIRKGFAGKEALPLDECRRRMIAKRSRIPPVDVHLDTDFAPVYRFGRRPVITFCSRCRNLVETEVHQEAGAMSVCLCVLLSLVFLWPCAPLPCFLAICADFTHFCPFCAHEIAKFRRGRSTRVFI